MTQVQAFFDTQTNTVTYLVWDEASREAMIIDPVQDYDAHAARTSMKSADAVLKSAEDKALTVTWVVDTHAHADHLSAGDYIRQKTGAKLGIGAHITKVQSTFASLFMAYDADDGGVVFDALFEEGDSFKIGNQTVSVIHTPGHTPACVSYIINGMAFVGDTLFMPDYGTARADFPGGDAHTLYQSIQKILSLPDETKVFTGHDYLPEGRKDYAWESTVKAQKNNVHLKNKTEDDYVKMREARDKTLRAPRLILPSLQVNIRAGALPPPRADGQVYLTLPVNRI